MHSVINMMHVIEDWSLPD